MTNEVANRTASTAIAALQTLKTGLANVRATIPSRNTEPFLRLMKDGNWVYGAEDIEVEEGSLWAINPMSFKHGYVAWTRYPAETKKKDVKIAERMVPMTSEKGTKPAPVNHDGQDWDWTDQVSCVLMCITGEDKGEQVLYSTTSVGGMNLMSELTGKIMEQLDRDPSRIVPCVLLQSDSYKHQNYGKVFVPDWPIKDWTPLTDDLPTEVGGEAEAEPEKTTEPAKQETAAAEPARRRRGAASEDKPEPQAAQQQTAAQAEPAQAEPARRRRRVA